MSRRGGTNRRQRAPMMSSETSIIMVGLGVVAMFVAAMGALLVYDDFAITAAVVAAAVLIAITYPMARRMATFDDDPQLVTVLMCALVAHLLGSVAIYTAIEVAFNGVADANLYHGGGVSVFEGFRSGSFEIQLGETLEAFPPETERIGIVTGIVYVFSGPSIYAGFLVFSWFTFLGLVLMTRGLRWGVPEANQRRYQLIILFLPSLLFWPSAIGKESWMLLCLGLVAYGAGRILGPHAHLSGLIPIAFGTAGATIIRPHVALVAAGSLGFALLFSVVGSASTTRDRTTRSRATRAIVLVLVVVLGLSASASVVERFSGGGESVVTTDDVLDEARDRTFVGGSKFETQPISSPLDIPVAIVSVVFRPFPWEAASLPVLISALEALVFIVLAWRGRQGLMRAPGNMWRRPYLVFCVTYSLAFIIAFSNISNAGLLARQRVQLFPLLLVLLALPAERWWKDRGNVTAGSSAEAGVA